MHVERNELTVPISYFSPQDFIDPINQIILTVLMKGEYHSSHLVWCTVRDILCIGNMSFWLVFRQPLQPSLVTDSNLLKVMLKILIFHLSDTEMRMLNPVFASSERDHLDFSHS